MYYIFSEKDSHEIEKPWEYFFIEKDTLEETKSYIKYMETKGYDVTVIEGSELITRKW